LKQYPIQQITDRLRKKYSEEDSIYLSMIGVLSEYRGLRLGSLLIRSVVEKSNVSCYLDTPIEKNIQIFERYGFEVKEHVQESGVEYWAMLRSYNW